MVGSFSSSTENVPKFIFTSISSDGGEYGTPQKINKIEVDSGAK